MSVQYIGFQNTGECVVLAARKEGASSFPVRITYRLAPHISCARESESRENSRFAIGDYALRLVISLSDYFAVNIAVTLCGRCAALPTLCLGFVR